MQAWKKVLLAISVFHSLCRPYLSSTIIWKDNWHRSTNSHAWDCNPFLVSSLLVLDRFIWDWSSRPTLSVDRALMAHLAGAVSVATNNRCESCRAGYEWTFHLKNVMLLGNITGWLQINEYNSKMFHAFTILRVVKALWWQESVWTCQHERGAL